MKGIVQNEYERKTDQVYMFPEGKNRANKFLNKKYVIYTCRVHPGETPASYMLKGIFDFLTS
jgi:hypothetical protein